MMYRMVKMRNGVERHVPCLDENVSKAAVQGIKFNDFTHWKEEEDGMRPRYLLELGGGYRLYANVPESYMGGPTCFQLLFSGKHSMFCFQATDYHSCNNSISFSSEGNCLTLELSMDPEEYARRYRRSRKNIVWTNYRDERVRLDAYRSRGKYWGSTDEWDDPGYEACLKDALLKAVIARNFSGLENDFRDIEDTRAGPAEMLFRYIDDARFPSDVECVVTMNRVAPVSFWMKGALTHDSDGIVSRGKDAAFTLKITGEDIEEFYGRHPEIPTTGRYLDENPRPSYANAVDDMEELRALVSTES